MINQKNNKRLHLYKIYFIQMKPFIDFSNINNLILLIIL